MKFVPKAKSSLFIWGICYQCACTWFLTSRNFGVYHRPISSLWIPPSQLRPEQTHSPGAPEAPEFLYLTKRLLIQFSSLNTSFKSRGGGGLCSLEPKEKKSQSHTPRRKKEHIRILGHTDDNYKTKWGYSKLRRKGNSSKPNRSSCNLSHIP